MKSGSMARGPHIGLRRRPGGVVVGGVGVGVPTLMYACQQGDVERVRRVLQVQPESCTHKDRTGKTPLHYCCCSEKVTAAQAADLLVMAAPELVETKDQDGFTPLHLAVIAGNVPLVTFLLANNADVNAVDNEKHTVVHWATVCGETVALRAVLAAGAPVSTPDVHGGYPLHYAAQMCGGEKDPGLGLQVLQTLLSHQDCVVSVQDGDGRQPLLWAASAGSAKAILALVKAGAAVEAPDKDGLTALHCAASRGHTDCIDTLLTLCGASPDIIDCNGCTALHYAVTLGHADATALLLGHGADPNRQDRKGRSPAHCGCAKGQFETVKMLGASGGNLWLRNARGDLPLHEAAASGRRDLVRWLLEARPSQVNARNNDGRCPLHLAALNDNADMCKILLDSGAHVNPALRTSKNAFMTPLDCALQRGFRSTAKFLQLHGGVPANRLREGRRGRHEQAANGSAMSLQIRDDVTFWGGSTTDSERENAGENAAATAGKARRRSLRRKFAYNYEQKKSPAGGDGGATTASSRNVGKAKNARTSNRKSARDGVSYSSEVKVDSKKDCLKIERNGEIVICEGEALKQGRRPRSAKSSKTGAKPPEAAKTDPTVFATKATSTEDNNNNQADAVDRTKEMVEIATQIDEELVKGVDVASHPDKKAPLQKTLAVVEDTGTDQQSPTSNTSHEEGEETKSLLVEASVHSPPKNVAVASSPVQAKDMGEELGAAQEKGEEFEKTSPAKEDVANPSPKGDSAEGKDAPIDKAEAKDVANTDNRDGDDEPLVQNAIEAIIIDDTVEEGLKPCDPARLTDGISTPVQKDTLVVDESDRLADSGLTTDDGEANAEGKAFEVLDLGEPPAKEVESEESSAFPKSVGAGAGKTYDDFVRQTSERRKRLVMPKDSVQLPRNRDSSGDARSSEEDNEAASSTSSRSDDSALSRKTHRSFTVLDDESAKPKSAGRARKARSPLKRVRSKSEENHKGETKGRCGRTKIPAPLNQRQRPRCKSDRHLEALRSRVPSLPDVVDPGGGKDQRLQEAPMGEDASRSDPEETPASAGRKKRLRKRAARGGGSKSAGGSDYESSNLIDSGFEPSPRSSRIPKCRNVSERGVNMASVTQSIQTNVRRYHLERKIFQQLLELKRLQIRSGQHNETILVKRAIDAYHRSCASTVGAGRYVPEDFTFKSFEKFLYHALRRLQRNGGAEHLVGMPETQNPLLCTKTTNRCAHTAHAYTGVPCAAYLPRMDHHTIPKIGFEPCRPSGFLPDINGVRKKAVTLELCHGKEKQVISLPADRLDQNKRYYVTFTVKGHEGESPKGELLGHRHAKSD